MTFFIKNAHWFLRIALASVFIYHGAMKFLNLEATAQMLPISYIEVVLVATAETIGGCGPESAGNDWCHLNRTLGSLELRPIRDTPNGWFRVPGCIDPGHAVFRLHGQSWFHGWQYDEFSNGVEPKIHTQGISHEVTISTKRPVMADIHHDGYY